MNAEILGALLRYLESLENRLPWPFNAVAFELAFWLFALLVGLVIHALPRQRISSIRARIDQIALFPRTPIWIALSALILRVVLLLWIPVPDASVHDEFSYLLGAKTLALFRLTNPSHPLAPFFESFHINVWPTYQSMYLPGQALFLALGILLVGSAWAGVLLAIALLCGSTFWMLRAYVPPRWALLGAIFCVLRFATFSYWVNGYWGGAVAALGGTLVLGAWPRLRKTRQPMFAALLALGLVLLAFTRTWEGFLFALPFGIAAMVWSLKLLKKGEPVRFLAAGVSLLVLAGAFLLYYDYRGTGHATQMPYAVNQQLYHITKPFVWQRAAHVPAYDHELMRRHYIQWEVPLYRALGTTEGRLGVLAERFTTYYLAFFWPMLLVTPFGLWFMLRDSRLRLPALAFLATVVAVLCEGWTAMPHYMAPALGSTLLIGISGLRMMHASRFRLGRSIAPAAVMLMAIWLAILAANAAYDPYGVASVAGVRQEWEQQRATSQLLRTPGDHLVIVHDRDNANVHRDWIHNGPDIDGQRVVWARDMGPYMDLYLLKYYSNRHVWWLDNDDGVMQLRPYGMRDLADFTARQATHFERKP